jgi:hypothetical protein
VDAKRRAREEKALAEAEAAFLRAVDFDLSVSPSLYARYYFMLRAVCQQDADDFPLARMWSWQRALRFADGPDEVHKMTIARRELRRHDPDFRS